MCFFLFGDPDTTIELWKSWHCCSSFTFSSSPLILCVLQVPHFLLPFLPFTVRTLPPCETTYSFSFLFSFPCLPHSYHEISSNLLSEASPTWTHRHCQYLSPICWFCCLRYHGKMTLPTPLKLGAHGTLFGQ